jgi:hypothetical protein
MPNDPHQFIEEMIQSAKKRQDVSVWLRHPETADLAKTVLKLTSLPRRNVELPNLAKIQERILAKIDAQQETKSSVWSNIPYVLKFGSAIFGSFMIIVSLTMGVAVAALQSVPGQAIYPLKKIVENIELRLTPESKVPALQIQLADKRIQEIKTVLEQQKSGEISEAEAQKIVSATVADLQRTTSAVAKSAGKQVKPTIVNRLSDISDELKIASVTTEGSVKIEIEKAIQSTQDSKIEAIRNAKEAGIEIEIKPILPDAVTASGKITSLTFDSVSIGTAKFLIDRNTQFVNLTAKELKAGLIVDITGIIKDNKTYAVKISVILSTPEPTETKPTSTETPTVSGSETTTEPQ